PFVEIAGFIILTIYTYYTAKMYSANQQAANAAESAAITAAKGLDVSRQQFRMDQRPYMFPEPKQGWARGKAERGDERAILKLENGGIVAVAVRVDLLNKGKSPAMEIFAI